MDLGALNRELAGAALAPGQDGWDQARAAWNLTADQNPAAVVFAESADDVATAVGFAAESELGVAVQATGHGATPRGELGDMLLLRTDRMKGTEIDAEAARGRFEAGVLAREAGEAAAAESLAGYPGSSPDTGIAGYTLGGGLSWFGRLRGLACNNLRAIELVGADGQQRRVDAENEPDLFWALRGGGGSFAAATAFEFELHDTTEVFAGNAIYAAGPESAQMLRRWRDWAAAAPEELSSDARFLNLPPLPQVPEVLQGRPLFVVDACFAADLQRGAELMAPIRELAEPLLDSFRPMPAAELPGIHMDPEQPVPGIGHTTSLRELPDEAIDRLVELAGPDSGSPLLLAELRQLGGALGRPAEGGGAQSQIDGEFVFVAIGMPMTPELGEAIPGRQDEICAALEPYAAERVFFNFAERPTDSQRLFDADTLARLRDVKQRYDPANVFRGNHPIEPG